jgi:hypothetical protein
MSDAGCSPALATLRPPQPSAPPSTTKTQITGRDIALPFAPGVTNTTVAVLARPPSQSDINKSNHTRAPNPHSPTAPPAQTPPAVSSLEAFRTPASVHPLTPERGRRPKTLNDTGRSPYRLLLRSMASSELPLNEHRYTRDCNDLSEQDPKRTERVAGRFCHLRTNAFMRPTEVAGYQRRP